METLFIGQNVIRLDTVDSTNNYAARLLRHEKNNDENGIFEGTIIVADFQEKGKGQRGNSWESQKGKNLTFSIILYPSFLIPVQQFMLNKIISLAIYDFLKSLNIANISIKWPNDIFIGENKIAGILIENTIRSNKIINSIIGIGINVNQKKFYSLTNATSLITMAEKKFNIDECLKKICSFIESRYIRLKSNIYYADNDYLNSLYQFNDWKNYIIKGEKIIAKITGITSSGLLMMEKENKEKIFCDFKEVMFTVHIQ